MLRWFMVYMRLQAAIELAAVWHRGQERDGEKPLPYVTHPVEVVSLLRYVGEVEDEELLCAAALHDLFEETEIRPEEIRAQFDSRVTDLVTELTRKEPDRAQIANLDKNQIWRLRAEMLLDEIGKMTADAQSVKLADRLSNVREAKRTKSGPKYERYVWQTQEILKIVPREVNLGLWKAIRSEIK